MKKIAFLVTIQPEHPQAKPEQRVYMNSEDLVSALNEISTPVIITEVTVYE